MASLDVAPIGPRESAGPPPRKRFKTSDLPLNAAQRSSIDSLLHTIKKKGAFDSIRKKVWSMYDEGDAKLELTNALAKIVESEIDRESALLSRERGKAATLIEGAVDRSGIYRDVEDRLDALICTHLDQVQSIARSIRREEVGYEKAAEEEKLGNKPDEEYQQEIAVKRVAREQARVKGEADKRKQEEKEKLLQQEKNAMLELEKLRRATERKQEAIALAQKRKAERMARNEAERKAEEQRRAERRGLEEKRKAEEEEKERE